MAKLPSEKGKSELPGMTGPGVERIAIPAVDALVDRYVAARDKRLDQLKREIDAKAALITSLHANVEKLGKDKDGVITYRHDDLIVTLKAGKDDLKVKTIGGDDDE